MLTKVIVAGYPHVCGGWLACVQPQPRHHPTCHCNCTAQVSKIENMIKFINSYIAPIPSLYHSFVYTGKARPGGILRLRRCFCAAQPLKSKTARKVNKKRNRPRSECVYPYPIRKSNPNAAILQAIIKQQKRPLISHIISQTSKKAVHSPPTP